MSFTNVEFIDTNVLVYAYARNGGPKQRLARALLDGLWPDARAAISIQVLQEFFVILTRHGAAPGEARASIDELATWPTFEPTRADVLAAIDNQAQWQISFWDAMILTAANELGASVVWSEDMSHGQRYGATTVRNPFLTSA